MMFYVIIRIIPLIILQYLKMKIQIILKTPTETVIRALMFTKIDKIHTIKVIMGLFM